jgi:TolB-like protein/Tfp pilus assembly protein PilF
VSFIAELKRRNVFRVGMAYAVVALVFLQVLDLVLEHTETPGWVMDVFMVLVALGFVIALVIAWAYELTPEGIKRDSEVDRSDSITQETAGKLNKITLAAVGLVVVLLIADRLIQPPPAPAPNEVQSATQISDAGSQEPEPLEKGIAVLPFTNLSEDEGNAFFAGGVHEDVLTHLSRISGLRVISRTSMIRIAERGLDVSEIGRQLGVSHVLEGSVRRSGDQVRVTVQLIDAADDAHLWAENYDRRLDDIFAIQSEIAREIATQLEAEMSPEAIRQIEEIPTTNLAAYDLYQQARELGRVWRAGEGFQQQRPLLEQAVLLDPDFLAAKLELAGVYGRLVWTGTDPEGIYRKKAELLTREIQQTWPDRPEAILAEARYQYTVNRDYEKALALYEQVLPGRPNDADLLLGIASSLKRLGRFDEGLKFIDQAIALDPEHPQLANERTFHLIGSGQVDAAFKNMAETLDRFPSDVSAITNMAEFSLSLRGDEDRFMQQMRSLEQEHPNVALTTDNYQRLRLETSDLDATIAAFDALQDDSNPWQRVFFDINVSELLNLASREAESVARARGALSSAETLMSEGRALPGNSPELYYARFAYAGCLASDPGAYNRYRSITRAMRPSEMGIANRVDTIMAMAAAECGDVNRAWALLEDNIRGLSSISAWDLILDPLWQHYFADLPEYRSLGEQTRSGQPAVTPTAD